MLLFACACSFIKASWYEHYFLPFMGNHFMPYGSEGTGSCMDSTIPPFQALYRNGVNNAFVFVHFAWLNGNR
jgi:hypothetical protein